MNRIFIALFLLTSTAFSTQITIDTINPNGALVRIKKGLSVDSAATANGFNANNKKITSVANGTSASDAVNKGQLDGVAAGMSWLEPVFDTITTLPGSPASNARYIMSQYSPIKDSIVVRIGGVWDTIKPSSGNSVWIDSLAAGYNYNGSAWVKVTGQYNHSSLLNLASDDHPQYLNNSRGDARYSSLYHGITTGYIPKATSATTFANSGLFCDTSGRIGIGKTNPTTPLDVETSTYNYAGYFTNKKTTGSTTALYVNNIGVKTGSLTNTALSVVASGAAIDSGSNIGVSISVNKGDIGNSYAIRASGTAPSSFAGRLVTTSKFRVDSVYALTTPAANFISYDPVTNDTNKNYLTRRTPAQVLSDIGGAPSIHGVSAGYIPKANNTTSFVNSSLYQDTSGSIGLGGTPNTSVALDILTSTKSYAGYFHSTKQTGLAGGLYVYTQSAKSSPTNQSNTGIKIYADSAPFNVGLSIYSPLKPKGGLADSNYAILSSSEAPSSFNGNIKTYKKFYVWTVPQLTTAAANFISYNRSTVDSNQYALTSRTPAQVLSDIGGAPTAHNQDWSTIESTPTTLSGYGITDAAPAAHGVSEGYIPYASSSTSWGSSRLYYDAVSNKSYFSGCNVGVGTNDPLVLFDVTSTQAIQRIKSTQDAKPAYTEYICNNGDPFIIGSEPNSGGVIIPGAEPGAGVLSVGVPYFQIGIGGEIKLTLHNDKLSIGSKLPAERLTIDQNDEYDDASGIGIYRKKSTNPKERILIYNNVNDYGFTIANQRANADNTYNNAGDITFRTAPSPSANVNTDATLQNSLVIKANGNVGIGVDAPSTKLQVAGDVSTGNIYVSKTGSSFPFVSLINGDYLESVSKIRKPMYQDQDTVIFELPPGNADTSRVPLCSDGTTGNRYSKNIIIDSINPANSSLYVGKGIETSVAIVDTIDPTEALLLRVNHGVNTDSISAITGNFNDISNGLYSLNSEHGISIGKLNGNAAPRLDIFTDVNNGFSKLGLNTTSDNSFAEFIKYSVNENGVYYYGLPSSFARAGKLVISNQGGNGDVIGTNNNTPIDFYTYGTHRMRISGTGKIMIGDTSKATADLQVGVNFGIVTINGFQGEAIWCTTSVALSKGSVVQWSQSADDRVIKAVQSTAMPIGIASDTIPANSAGWIITNGYAWVKFIGGVTGIHGWIVYVSSTDGLADNSSSIPANAQYNATIGHVARSGSSGGLALCTVRFN